MNSSSKIFAVISLLFMRAHISAFTILGEVQKKLSTIPSIKDISQAIDAQKFGQKKLCVITGTSSGLGRSTAKQLLSTGRWHVIGAVRDLDKMATVAEVDEFDPKSFTAMECDLGSFDSVRKFVNDLNEFKSGRHIDRLVCNAAVYQPSLDYAKYTVDDIEQQAQINYLSHFLMCSLLLPDLKEAKGARVIMVGSVTGNDNTVGGGGVYPIADLRDMQGLESGLRKPVDMIDGYKFNGAKAYKDTKLCLMMIANELHRRYNRQTGVAFSAIYPGCIASSPLFREKRPWFRKYFPVFMKYITGGYVGEEEAGKRLFQVIVDPRCTRSGVYWSWNGGPRQGRGADAIKNDGQIVGAGGAGGDWDSIFENDPSDKVLNEEMGKRLFDLSSKVTGAEWMPAKQPKSPCPTLTVIRTVQDFLDSKEEKEQRKLRPATMRDALAL